MLRTLAIAAVLTATAVAQCTTVIVPVPIGANGDIHLLRRLANGDILVGGDFTSLLGVPTNRIARWNGTTVAPLGSGLNGVVHDAIELPNGDLVVGGTFTTAGGAPIPHIARWDGTTWSGFGPGPGAPVTSLAVRPNGEIYAGAAVVDRVRRWDGTSWSGIGVPPFPWPGIILPVWAMHTLQNGDLLLSGWSVVTTPGAFNCVVRWDGAALHAMPGLGPLSQGGASRFVARRDGTLLAVGDFLGMLLLQWDGSTWSQLPGAFSAFGGASDVCELPDGDLVMCGAFFYVGSNQQARGLVRRHNGAWEPFGAGIVGGARALLAMPNGEVLVGGNMTVVDGQPANGLALLVPTCPAAATPYGNACSGSGGALVLTATSLPYCGGLYTSRTTGLPPNALGLGMLGYTALAVPVSTVLPQGLPGCTLLVSPDELTLLLPAAGAVTTALAVPNAPVLVGATLQQQVASIELGPNGAITAIATTAGLTLTIGSF